MDNASILMTDFGAIKLGPKFTAVFCADALKKSKNSKAYKAARDQADITYKAFNLMHQACFRAGVEMSTDAP